MLDRDPRWTEKDVSMQLFDNFFSPFQIWITAARNLHKIVNVYFSFKINIINRAKRKCKRSHSRIFLVNQAGDEKFNRFNIFLLFSNWPKQWQLTSQLNGQKINALKLYCLELYCLELYCLELHCLELYCSELYRLELHYLELYYSTA